MSTLFERPKRILTYLRLRLPKRTSTLGILSEMAVPFPPAKEQDAVVGEIESRLSVVHNIAVVIETEMIRAVRLRQSILRTAFSGHLIKALIPETQKDELSCLVCK